MLSSLGLRTGKSSEGYVRPQQSINKPGYPDSLMPDLLCTIWRLRSTLQHQTADYFGQVESPSRITTIPTGHLTQSSINASDFASLITTERERVQL
jgi:hypothetical protein